MAVVLSVSHLRLPSPMVFASHRLTDRLGFAILHIRIRIRTPIPIPTPLSSISAAVMIMRRLIVPAELLKELLLESLVLDLELHIVHELDVVLRSRIHGLANDGNRVLAVPPQLAEVQLQFIAEQREDGSRLQEPLLQPAQEQDHGTGPPR